MEMSQAMVKEGTAGMVYEEVQNLTGYEDALGEDWGYFDFPEIEGASGEPATLQEGRMYLWSTLNRLIRMKQLHSLNI